MTNIPKSPIIIFLSAVILILAGAKLGSLYREANHPTPPVVVSTPQKKAPVTPPTGDKTPDIRVKPEDPVLGSANAKVTIIEFGDFQCPFCGRFFKDIEPQLKKDYIDTGKAKFVFKHLAFLGQESLDAANASLCAKEQSKFWEYHDKLYQNQMGENQGAFAPPNLKRFAADLGLNASKFNNCLDTQKYMAQVQADTTEVKAKGYSSTPTTFINGSVIVGAQPYATFKTVIDEKLAGQP